MSTKLTPSFGLFTKSKEIVVENFNTFGLLLLLPLLTGLFTSIHTRHMKGYARFTSSAPNFGLSGSTIGLSIVIGLALVVVGVVVSLMLYMLNLESAKQKKPTVGELWPMFQKYGGRLFLLFIVMSVIFVLGLMALIAPGIIFIGRFYMAPYAMLDKDLSISEALKESHRISKQHEGSIWGLIGVTLVLSLPGVVPIIGWSISFVLTSLYTVAPALRYFELKKLSHSEN